MTAPHSQLSILQKLLIGLGLSVAAMTSLLGYVAYDVANMDLGKIRIFKEGVGPGYDAAIVGESD